VSKDQALLEAQKANLDLVEVAPEARPPVCKIMDYGKHQYYQKKVDTKHRKSQKKADIKGIRLGFKIGDHDIEVKANQARKFLENGNVVKVSLIFRGREVVYKNLGLEKMDKFFEGLKDVCTAERPPSPQGNMQIMILTPIKK